MKTCFRHTARRFQRGVVAVEAAVIITLVLLPLLASCLFLGRYFWYYTVAQKAAHDAALYMSHAPLIEIKAPGTPAVVLANYIISAETADMDPSTATYPTAICEYKTNANASPIWMNCNGIYTPLRIRAGVAMSVSDPFFTAITWAFTNGEPIPISTDATMNYNGR